MRLPLTRSVPIEPLPESWAGGATYPEVERIAGGVTNSWSISPEAARVVARIVVVEHRTRVLEFGAGVSSRIFAAAFEASGGGRLTSVEEAPQWCAEAWTLVERSPNVDAKLIPASVHLKVERRGVYFGYRQLDEIARRGPYDFVFVDAPTGAYGRDGALQAAFDSMLPGGLLVLDDARRAPEQRTLRRWLLNYPELRLVANDPSVARGLAVLEKRQEPQRAVSRARAAVEIWGSGLCHVLGSPWGIHRHRRRQRRLKQAR